MDAPPGYFNRRKSRAPFRPTAEGFGDRFIGRDRQYWLSKLGRRQRPWERVWMPSAQVRARNIPFLTRAQFHERFGQDADFDGWLQARKYRPEDLDDPVVFDNILYGRKIQFHSRYDDAMRPFQLQELNEAEEEVMRYGEPTEEDLFSARQVEDQIKQERKWEREQLAVRQYRERERQKRQRELTPDVEDLPVVLVGKKVKFEE